LDRKIEDLDYLLASIVDIKWELESLDDLLENEEIVNETLELYEKLHELDDKIEDLDGLIENIELLESEIAETDKKVERLHAEFDREFPDVCPLCGKEK
jgi:predicted nuclease with TOPRIM domain